MGLVVAHGAEVGWLARIGFGVEAAGRFGTGIADGVVNRVDDLFGCLVGKVIVESTVGRGGDELQAGQCHVAPGESEPLGDAEVMLVGRGGGADRFDFVEVVGAGRVEFLQLPGGQPRFFLGEDHLVAWDDLGRIAVVDLQRGEVLADLRL